MKSLTILLLLFFTINQDSTIKGKYKMIYQERYNSQNCIINFNDNTYKRKLTNGKVIKGDIEFKNSVIFLKDREGSLSMTFLKSEISKDTIPFGTINTSDKFQGDIIIHSGRLIKQK